MPTALSSTSKHLSSPNGTRCLKISMKPDIQAACILDGAGGGRATVSILLHIQLARNERVKQPALISGPRTTSHVEISGPHFSFAPPPPYGLKRAGQGLASGCGWQGAMSFPRVASLPGLSAPSTARQQGLLTPSASHQAEQGVGVSDSFRTPPNCPFLHPDRPQPLLAPFRHSTNSYPSERVRKARLHSQHSGPGHHCHW